MSSEVCLGNPSPWSVRLGSHWSWVLAHHSVKPYAGASPPAGPGWSLLAVLGLSHCRGGVIVSACPVRWVNSELQGTPDTCSHHLQSCHPRCHRPVCLGDSTSWVLLSPLLRNLPHPGLSTPDTGHCSLHWSLSCPLASGFWQSAFVRALRSRAFTAHCLQAWLLMRVLVLGFLIPSGWHCVTFPRSGDPLTPHAVLTFPSKGVCDTTCWGSSTVPIGVWTSEASVDRSTRALSPDWSWELRLGGTESFVWRAFGGDRRPKAPPGVSRGKEVMGHCGWAGFQNKKAKGLKS